MIFSFFGIRRQVFAFVVVGFVGFLIDVGVLWLLLERGGIDPYRGRAVSCFAAILATWLLNRTLTFQRSAHDLIQRGVVRSELSIYILFQTLGLAVNLSVYGILVFSLVAFQSLPILAVALGSSAAMFVNFSSARWLFTKKYNPYRQGSYDAESSVDVNGVIACRRNERSNRSGEHGI